MRIGEPTTKVLPGVVLLFVGELVLPLTLKNWPCCGFKPPKKMSPTLGVAVGNMKQSQSLKSIFFSFFN
jgi:hypothetical protein